MPTATVTTPALPRIRACLQSWRWVLALGLVLGLSFQGSRSLWETDEGRYTQVALNMLRSGDWLTPHRHHHRIHPTKPPLTYWAIASSVATFGRSEWAVRLPNALAFAGTLWLLFWIGTRLVPALPGLPALIYGTMAVPYFATNWVSTDVLLTFFETLAMACFIAWRWPTAAPTVPAPAASRLWLIGMWLGFGLAFLTKGPPALLPLLALIGFHLGEPGFARRGRLFPWLGVLGFLLVGGTWYLLVVMKNPGLLEYLIKDEVIGRVSSDDFGRFPQWWGGFYVYGFTFLLGTLPWSLAAAWATLRGPMRDPAPGPTPDPTASSQRRLLWLWIALPLCLFMLSRSRLPLYALPLLLPVAVLFARQLARRPHLLKLSLLLLPVWIVLILAIKWSIAWMPHARTPAELWRITSGAQAYLPQNKDMRAFAHGLLDKVPFTPIELVFVEESPRFGLGFYLNVETEWIGLDQADPRFDDYLEHELREREPGQPVDGKKLYLVKADRQAAFEAALAKFGWRGVHYGEQNHLQLLGVEKI